MHLTVDQSDALTELINVGYGRAAAALSEMTGHRIRLDVPRVSLHEIAAVGPVLRDELAGEVVCVNQVFSGPFAGNALLLLDPDAALLLSKLLVKTPDFDVLGATALEIVSEAGNILLTACLGAFGNLLEVQVAFSIPRLCIENVSGLLKSISTSDQNLSHALIVATRFHLRASDVSGYFMIVFGITSLERVLEELDDWELRQY